MAENPYAAPRAHVEDAGTELQGEFVAEGRSLPAGRGWTWIAEGFSLFRRQPVAWILITVVFLVIAIVIEVVPGVGHFAMLVLTPVFTGGIMLGCRQLDDGSEMGVGALFAGFSTNGGRLALLGVSSLLALLAIGLATGLVLGIGGAVIGFGRHLNSIGPSTLLLAVLVVLALSLPVYMALWFAPALIVLNDLSLGDALTASFKGCLRNATPFLVYGVIALVLFLLALIPAMLGLLVMVPVLFASIYTGYRDIYYVR
jgi:uncharacterized membrane protein